MKFKCASILFIGSLISFLFECYFIFQIANNNCFNGVFCFLYVLSFVILIVSFIILAISSFILVRRAIKKDE